MRVTIIAILLPGLAAAADFAVPAPATEAIVYLQGIDVLRRAEVDLPAGSHRILVPAMPGAANAPRIEVTGATIATIATFEDGLVDGRMLLTPAQEAAHDAWRDAVEAASRADDARDRAAATVRAAQDALAFLRSVEGGDLGEATPERIGAVAGAVAGGVTAAEVARADAAAALRAAEAEAEAAERRAEQARRDLDATGADLGPVTLLALSVDAAEAGPVTVTMRAFSPAGGWSLAYDIDLGADDAVTLTRIATITQGTGLPLDGVALRLSTADPFAQAAPTEPQPDLARAEDLPPPLYPIPEPRMRAEAFAADAAPALVARADTGGPVVAYDVPGRVDLPVSGDPVRLALAPIDLAARVFNRATPRHDATAFRMAAVTNDTPEPLLAGPATLTREGQRTGEGFLPLLPAGDEAELSFGPVEHLRLEYRALGNQTGDAGLFSTSGTRRQDLVYRVRNLSDAPEIVETRIALPFSEQDDLEIRVETAPAPDLRDVEERRGVAQWDLAVPGNGEAEVRVGVEMRWPEGLTLLWEP